MNRKKALCIIAISLFFLIVLAILSGKGERYSELIISEEELQDIVAAREQEDAPEAVISFDDQELVFEKNTKTYYYSLVEDSASSYNPKVQLKNADKAKVAFVEDEISDELISSNSRIQGVIYNDDYYTLFDVCCTTLPVMSIDCGEITEIESDASLYLYDNRKGATGRITQSEANIRIRGGNTRFFPKKPLKLELKYTSLGNNLRNNDLSLLGMRKDSDWILYPAYNDCDKVRNVFSQNLWRDSCLTDNELGVKTGVEFKYLELFINGEYYGLYALGYTMDESMLAVGSMDTTQGLYKKVVGISSQKVYLGEDGYIYGFRIVHPATKEPEYYDKSKRWELLLNYYINLDLNAGNSEYLLDYIDIDNAIDYYLFINLIQGDDNQFKNYYLALYTSGDKIKSIYSPWDLDVSWGNMWIPNAKNGYVQYGHTVDYNLFMEDTYLEQILRNGDAGVLEKVIERYEELRRDVWSDDVIMSYLDEYEEEIFGSGAYFRDMARWPEGNYIQDGNFNLDRFKEYVRERLAEADEYYERLKDYTDASCFIRRSAGYKHFAESDFVIEINDRDKLSDPEYIELFDYVGGIDISRITEDIRYVVRPINGETLYIPEYYSEDEYKQVVDAAEELSFDFDSFDLCVRVGEERDYEYDTGYTVYYNSVACYDTALEYKEPVIVSLVYDGFGQKMNLNQDFTVRIQ